MPSYEKQERKLATNQVRSTMTRLSEEQRLKLQHLPGQAGDENSNDARLDDSASQSPAAVSDQSSFSSLPVGLEGENPFAFYPSGSDPSEEPCPTLADAVIEHLRQARLRRRRPH